MKILGPRPKLGEEKENKVEDVDPVQWPDKGHEYLIPLSEVNSFPLDTINMVDAPPDTWARPIKDISDKSRCRPLRTASKINVILVFSHVCSSTR